MLFALNSLKCCGLEKESRTLKQKVIIYCTHTLWLSFMLLMKSQKSSSELCFACVCVCPRALSCSETAKPTDGDKSDEEEKGERSLFPPVF